MKCDTGHWIWHQAIDPSAWAGFIYVITNTTNNKKYIGRKTFISKRRKQVKCKGDATKKKTQITRTESDWKTYTGSSAKLNEDITRLGKDKFRFEILSLHKSLSQLNYAEVHALVTQNALISYFKNGEPAFYNGLIPPVRTRPSQDNNEEEEEEGT